MGRQYFNISNLIWLALAFVGPNYYIIICEMPGRMKHKLESRLPGETSITSDMQITPPLLQKVKKN